MRKQSGEGSTAALARPDQTGAPGAAFAADRVTLALVGVLLATLIVYLRCLGNGFVFDDNLLVLGNRYIGQWSFLWKAFVNDEYWFVNPFSLPVTARYRPLLLDWVGLNYHLFGLSPVGWHAAMVALHLLVAVLVYRVAAALTDDRPAAVLAAAFFALLAGNAEAVVWVAAFGLALAAAFELAAFDLFIRRAGRGVLTWWLALVLYAAALLTHETAAAFPAVIVCYVFLVEAHDSTPAAVTTATWASAFTRAGQRLLVAFRCALPFIVELIAYLAARRLVLGYVTMPPGFEHATKSQTVLTVPLVLATYLMTIVAPWTAGPSHRVFLVSSPASYDFYLPLAVLVAVVVAFVAALKNHRRRYLYLFCAAWFFVTIAPVLYLPGLIEDQIVNDNYRYLPSVGLCVMAADWALYAARKGVRSRWLVSISAAAFLAASTIFLWRVQPFWRDDVAFFSHCIAEFPEAAAWHGELGARLAHRGEMVRAEHELSQAVSLAPRNGMFLYDLGLVHVGLGRFEEGMAEASEGLRRMTGPPVADYIALSQLYAGAGQQERSESMLKIAESLPGGQVETGFMRARTEAKSGQLSVAESTMRALAARYPDDYRVRTALGQVLDAENRSDEALQEYQRALAMNPPDAGPHFFAARTLHKLGRDEKAIEQCRLALSLAPGDARTLALMRAIERGRAPAQRRLP